MARVTVASELSLDVARSTTRAVAASRHRVPQTLATAMSTDSSGRQASDHPSLNVPVPLVRAGAPPVDRRARRSRCSSRDAREVVGLAQVQLERLARAGPSRAAAAGRSRGGPPPAGRSAPRRGRCPGVRRRRRRGSPARRSSSSPWHSTDRVASVTSASPASGRPRIVATASASRTASMTWADDTGRSFSRSRPATLVSHRGTTWSGVREQVVVPPGRLDPRAVARRVRQPGVRPRDPGHHRPSPSASP